MRTWVARFSVLILLVFAATLLRAQDSSSMTGVVTDATGAVIPGTTITLTNSQTGTRFQQTTNSKGSYRFANVPPANGYTAVFSHAGFSDVKIDNIALSVGVPRTQSARLQPGANVEVSVSAANQEVTLNTTDASIGNNMDVQDLNQLPILDRTAGITTLFLQQPGVDSFQGAVTGARIDQSEVTVDGMDVNDIAAGTTFNIVANAPVDSVDQFTGTVAGLNPSIGTGGGGQFQLVTKHGTNRFHGNINEYHRDTTTEANTWFNNLDGLPRTPLIRNQFGGNIGGPIKRDKLFFFFDLADSRIIQSSSAERIVPLSNLTSATPTLNYINDGAGCGDGSRQTTQPQCISPLSVAQVAALDPSTNPTAKGFDTSVLSYLASRYPAANDLSEGDGVNTGGYRFTTPTPDLETAYIGRIDYHLSSKHLVFGRFTINRENAISVLPEFPTDPLTHPLIDRSYAYVVSDVWTIGANKVNQIYYGDTISKYDFPDDYNPTGPNQPSFTGLSGPYTSFDGQERRVPIPMFRDDFNWQLGTHSLTMGGTFKFIKTNTNLISNFNFPDGGLAGVTSSGFDASVRPADIATGGTANANNVAVNDYDSLFADTLGSIGEISTNYDYTNTGAPLSAGSGSPRAYRFFQTEAYIGDTWKATPHLTLSYGLRYQFYSVPFEVKGEESVPLDASTNAPITLNTFMKDRLAQIAAGDTSPTGLPIFENVLGGKANNGPNLYQPSYKDIAPRFAFSYNPAYSPSTVINGSAAIVYDRTVIAAIDNLQDQISYLFSNTQVNEFSGTSADNALATNPRFGANLSYPAADNPAPAAIASPYVPYDYNGFLYGLGEGQTNFVISPNLKDPYSIMFNFGVQQEFPGHLIMKLNYVGRLGRRLLADADAGQVIDVPDISKNSTQSMSQAFAGLTTQLRSGAAITAQPWFENVLGGGANYGAAYNAAILAAYGVNLGITNNTQLVSYLGGQDPVRGDISDTLYTLGYYTELGGLSGFLPDNIGLTSQFGSNTYLTNQGSSSYNGLLLTVDKNMSQGLRFEFNYTWSHSIDNTSLSANNNALFSDTGFLCDILHPRACRASSDFDVNQEITSNFVYQLPFGHGKQFLGNDSRWLDEAIGGWSFSGLPSYRTGLAITPYSDAFLASFNNGDPAIFTGNKPDLRAVVNVDHSTNTVYGFAGGAAGAAKVLSEFRGPIGIEYGQRNLVRGPGAFFFDAGLGKTFPIVADHLNLVFRADAFNIFNHPNFGPQGGTPAGTGNLNIVTNASNFGQITATNLSPSSLAAPGDNQRVAQFSARLEF